MVVLQFNYYRIVFSLYVLFWNIFLLLNYFDYILFISYVSLVFNLYIHVNVETNCFDQVYFNNKKKPDTLDVYPLIPWTTISTLTINANFDKLYGGENVSELSN